MSEKDILTEEQAEKITYFLIKNGIDYIDQHSNLYRKIQWIAAKLGIIDEDPMNISIYNPKILSNGDFLKVIDQIWSQFIKGHIAPGKNNSNPWFPHVHLTKKGKEFFEGIKFE